MMMMQQRPRLQNNSNSSNIQKQQKVKIKNGYKHRRNPSIGTLIKSKRYQQATPTHNNNGHQNEIFFPTANTNASNEINRLRIENSHAMKKYDDLSARNSILHKGIKQSKQRYKELEEQFKKLKKSNEELQKQLNDQRQQQHNNNNNYTIDDDTFSSFSFKTHIQSLEDTHKKEQIKYAKIKNALEDIINDHSLPSHLRTKLTSLLPNFYNSHRLRMHLSDDESDNEQPISPIFDDEIIECIISPTPTPTNLPKNDPILLNSASASLVNANHKSNKANVVKKKRNSKLLNFRRRTPKKMDGKRRKNHRRSASQITYKEALTQQQQTQIIDDHESEHDDEEKEFNLTPKTMPSSPTPKSSATRHKKPPPPPRPKNRRSTRRKVKKPQHPKYANSDDLRRIGKRVQIHPKTKNLALINENQQSPTTEDRIRSVSEYIASPSSTLGSSNDSPRIGWSMKAHKGSPLRLCTALDTSMNGDDDDENMDLIGTKVTKRVLYERKNKNISFDFDQHYFNGNGHHKRSQSNHHRQMFSDSDDFSTDNENIFVDPFQAKRKEYFHSNVFKKNIGNKSKKNTKQQKSKKHRRKTAIKVSKKEEQNLAKRRRKQYERPKMKYSKSANMKTTQLIKHEKKRSSLSKLKPAFLNMSVANLTDAMSESSPISPHSEQHYQSMNINPLSPINPKKMDSTHLSKVLRFDEVKKLAKITGDNEVNLLVNDGIKSKNIKISSISSPNSPNKQQKISKHPKTKSSSLQLTKNLAKNRQKKVKKNEDINSMPRSSSMRSKSIKKNERIHQRSASLKGVKLNKLSFSLSPSGSKSKSKTRNHSKQTNSGSFGSKSISKRSNSSSSSNSDSDAFMHSDKVWTLRDLIREMVSNYDDADRVRNALILCHKSYTTSVHLFQSLRSFFRMSMNTLTSEIFYFDDEDDENYANQDDRRWFMRQQINQCIAYWIYTYWKEDFEKNKELQQQIEHYKSDIRAIFQFDRSKILLEPLMDALNEISVKFGGINPKNLNLPSIDWIKSSNNDKNEIMDVEDDDHKYNEPSEEYNDSLTRGSVVIYADDDDADTVIDGSLRREKDTMALLNQSRERRSSINRTPTKLPQVSQTDEAKEIVKSYKDGKIKKEMQKLAKNLRLIDVRFPDLIKFEMVIPQSLNIMELDPEDVAIQLTLLDSFVFKKIRRRECIEQSWKKKDKALRAPNILMMIAQFEDVSKWVQYTILKGTTPRFRKRFIKKMISMATCFMTNGNLSSLCAFHAALTSTNILNLHATWKLLSKSKRRELDAIKALFGWKMSKFKSMQEELQPPCVPHLGLMLQALFQIDEGKSNKNLENGGINYAKMMMLNTQIENVELLQSDSYKDEPNFLIQKLLLREFRLQSDLTEDDLWKLGKSVAESEKNLKK